MPNESFLKVADLLPEAMLLVSADGTILAANRSVERCLRLSPEKIQQRRLQEVVADDAESLALYLRLRA